MQFVEEKQMPFEQFKPDMMQFLYEMKRLLNYNELGVLKHLDQREVLFDCFESDMMQFLEEKKMVSPAWCKS